MSSERKRDRGCLDHEHGDAVELLQLRADHGRPRRARFGESSPTIPSKTGAASYASYSGTSMACPHVTGGVALYAATHPGASVATIKAAVLGSVVATPALAGKCATGGRLNVSGF